MTALTIITVILLLLGLGVIFVLVEYGLRIADRARQLASAAGLDLVQLYSAAHMARLDITQRERLLELAQDNAAADLRHRLALDRLQTDKLLIELGAHAHHLRLAGRAADETPAPE